MTVLKGPNSTHAVTDPNLGDVERSFRLHIPAGYSSANDVETPLLLDFHGMFGFGNSLRCFRNSKITAYQNRATDSEIVNLNLNLTNKPQ